jgi:hypothetical protein
VEKRAIPTVAMLYDNGVVSFPSGAANFYSITTNGLGAYKVSTGANVNANWYQSISANAEL